MNNKMKKAGIFFAGIPAFFFFLLAFAPFIFAAEEGTGVFQSSDLSSLDFSEKKPVAIVVSSDWHDAFLISSYAERKGVPMRFLVDKSQVQKLITELEAGHLDTAVVFTRKGNEISTLPYRLRSTNLNVFEIFFDDYEDLQYQLAKAEGVQPGIKSAVILRGDFAYDALSSKFLAFALDAPVLFAKSNEQLNPKALEALKLLDPAEVYAIGNLKDNIAGQLGEYNVMPVAGRDQFETTLKTNALALKLGRQRGWDLQPQAMITPGDIFDLALMQSRHQPILLLPYEGTYSLFQTAEFISENGINFLVGVGTGVTDSGDILRQRTGARVVVKLGSVSSTQVESAIVKRDVANFLEGYLLPFPTYNGTLEMKSSSYVDYMSVGANILLGATPQKIAPPAMLRASFENTGNAEAPVAVSFKVSDKGGTQVALMESAEQIVLPGQKKDFTVLWNDAPAEGRYSVEALGTINVYEGIALKPSKAGIDLSWVLIWLSLAFLIIFALLLAWSAYYLRKTRKKLGHAREISGEVEDKIGEIHSKISRMGRKK